MGLFLVLAIIGGSGLIAYLLGREEEEDQESIQKYMMVEDKHIIHNQSFLSFQ